MQSELKMALDEAAFTVNGEFDASTTHALKRFQSQAGLEPGGVVGPHTWAALDSVKGGVPESAEDSQRISDLYLAGLGMFDAGNFDGALAKFTDVYPDRAARHKATYLVPYMMAACHHNKGRFADAVSLYEEALAMPTTTMDDRGSSMENLRRARLGEGFMTGAEMAQGQAQGSAAGP
jgi:tetratricopeptide (TPR) repeat protein